MRLTQATLMVHINSQLGGGVLAQPEEISVQVTGNGLDRTYYQTCSPTSPGWASLELSDEFNGYLPSGTYTIKVSKLRYTQVEVASLVLSQFTTTGPIVITMWCGDIDGDSEIGPSDFGALSSAFGSVEGDPNWDPAADLDGDGEVGPSDFGILSTNYGLTSETAVAYSTLGNVFDFGIPRLDSVNSASAPILNLILTSQESTTAYVDGSDVSLSANVPAYFTLQPAKANDLDDDFLSYNSNPNHPSAIHLTSGKLISAEVLAWGAGGNTAEVIHALPLQTLGVNYVVHANPQKAVNAAL